VPSYESRITTSKLLIELENYEVIILTSLVNALLIVFLVFLMFIPTVTLALSLEHWYSPEAMTADTCIGIGQNLLVRAYCSIGQFLHEPLIKQSSFHKLCSVSDNCTMFDPPQCWDFAGANMLSSV